MKSDHFHASAAALGAAASHSAMSIKQALAALFVASAHLDSYRFIDNKADSDQNWKR